MTHDCLIVGSGPAALLAGDLLSASGVGTAIFERRSGAGWKLLVAGSSGLNVSYDAPLEKFHEFYFSRQAELARCFREFGPEDWLEHLADLGEEPCVGTSRRYFVKNWKATALLETWKARLEENGATFHFNEELRDFTRLASGEIEVTFHSGRKETAHALLLALGGASWENELPAWTQGFRAKGIALTPFRAANVGYHLEAPPAFFAAAAGQAIKGLVLTTARGTKQGELMVTKYGLEGTPVYTVGCTGPGAMDLKPELPEDRLEARLAAASGGMLDRIRSVAKLSPGALLLVEHLAPANALESSRTAAQLLKSFPIRFLEPRPLAEAISSAGGLSWDELNASLELKKCPGVFCAGEMIDWDAPTGGFLIQASVSTGFVAAEGVMKYLEKL